MDGVSVELLKAAAEYQRALKARVAAAREVGRLRDLLWKAEAAECTANGAINEARYAFEKLAAPPA